MRRNIYPFNNITKRRFCQDKALLKQALRGLISEIKYYHDISNSANFIKTIDILYQTFYNYKVNVFVMGVLCPDGRKASGLNKFIRRIKGAKS